MVGKDKRQSTAMDRLRPAQYAAIVFALGDTVPRQRARDQQADTVGLELKHRILQAVLEKNPTPEDFSRFLFAIVDELASPNGPATAICRTIFEEWETMVQYPQVTRWLLESGVQRSAGPRHQDPRKTAQPASQSSFNLDSD